jgi:hypothetical protein
LLFFRGEREREGRVLKVGNPLDDGSNFKCIKCNEKGELAFAPYPIIDWRCGLCGEWQQEGEK